MENDGMESRSGGQMYMPTGETFWDFFLHLEPSFNVYLLLLCLICVSLFHLPVYIIRHCFRSFVFLPSLSWLYPTCCQICLIFPPMISRKSSPLWGEISRSFHLNLEMIFPLLAFTYIESETVLYWAMMVAEGNAGMKICAVYTLFLMATNTHS